MTEELIVVGAVLAIFALFGYGAYLAEKAVNAKLKEEHQARAQAVKGKHK
jgi:uncharacterized protein YneF (UPF0154 family)